MLEPFTTAMAGAWLWENYGKDLTEFLKKKSEEAGVEIAQQRWRAFQWQQAEKSYKEKLARLYGTTRILGNSEPTSLEGIFTDLYILDKPLAARFYDLEQLKASDDTLQGRNVQRLEGIMVIKREQNHRLFILGKPGAGKTTFLKYITLQALKGDIKKTPIFIGLREWAESNKTLMEFIIEQFTICNFPEAKSFIEYLLEKGNAILLLDGLDEVNAEYNARIIKSVKDFCRKYDKTQCLITCRVAATDYSFENFKYLEVADFTPTQIEIFVKKWFAKELIKRDKFLTEFKQEQYRGLRELASSPLLLGMLCLAFSDSMEFTTRRVDIYEDAIDALLRKWDSSRSINRDIIYQGLNHHLKKRLFTAIAYKTFSDNQYLLKEKELANYLVYALKKLPNTEKQDLDGEVVLKAIEAQHGIFVERAQKIHSFAHLTFQEYFTACMIKGNANYQKELMQHITDPRWREVFLLAASLLDEADDFFNLFKTAIANLINQDRILVEFLHWADVKANSVQSDNQPREIRFFYIVLELIFSIDFDPTLMFSRRTLSTFISHAYGRAHVYTRERYAQTRDHAHAHIRIFDLAREIEFYSKDMSCDYLLNATLTNSWFFANSNEKIFKQLQNENYQEFIEFFSEIINRIRELGFESLVVSLIQLQNKIPDKTTIQNDWCLFLDQLAILLQTQRNISKYWNITKTQNKLLTEYFTANSLLLDCLNSATVSSERDTIKNGLFLPPSE